MIILINFKAYDLRKETVNRLCPRFLFSHPSTHEKIDDGKEDDSGPEAANQGDENSEVHHGKYQAGKGNA